MECDEPDCDVAEGPAPNEDALSLPYFREQGWFIAQFHGDCCPKCVEAGRADNKCPMPEEWFSYPSLNQLQKTGAYDTTGLGNMPVRAIDVAPSRYPSTSHSF